VIKVSVPSSPFNDVAIQAHLSKVVEGEQIEFSDAVLETITDLSRVRKIYKLHNTGKVTSQSDGGAGERRELEMLILGSMALRGATN
jgi:EKC/KEOPS complex subunit CGI121/TPRKB